MSGRSVVEQIFAGDEGVMGLHNDRRTDEKMPTNGRSTDDIKHIVYWLC